MRSKKKKAGKAIGPRTVEAMQLYAHASSADVGRRMRVVRAQLEEMDGVVAESRRRIAAARRDARELEAELEGLAAVVGMR